MLDVLCGCSLYPALPVRGGVCWCSCKSPPSPISCRCLIKILSGMIVLPWCVFMEAVASNPSRVLAALGLEVCTL